MFQRCVETTFDFRHLEKNRRKILQDFCFGGQKIVDFFAILGDPETMVHHLGFFLRGNSATSLPPQSTTAVPGPLQMGESRDSGGWGSVCE